MRKLVCCEIRDSLIGKIALIADDEAVLRVMFIREEAQLEGVAMRSSSVIEYAFSQLDEYFEGRRKNFDVPVKLRGTDFQVKVWEAMRLIPYGHAASYGDVAELIGNRKSAHAVGGAVKANHLAIFIPCHRVIASGGKIGGYNCGLDIKRALLRIEGIYL